MRLSVIVPARNEAALVAGTLAALVRAAAELPPPCTVEILLVDNGSTDDTATAARHVAGSADAPVRLLVEPQPGAARARNRGAAAASGDVLVFVDADTHVPPEGLRRVVELHAAGFEAGMFRLDALDGGIRARVWWWFWNQVRRLPLARAKAMSAFMFCTREVFDTFGPFDTSVEIAEEWPLLAGPYRARRERFVFDRSIAARSSSRRMEMRRLGYLANGAKYVWAVLHRSGRRRYTDRYRAPSGAER